MSFECCIDAKRIVEPASHEIPMRGPGGFGVSRIASNAA